MDRIIITCSIVIALFIVNTLQAKLEYHTFTLPSGVTFHLIKNNSPIIAYYSYIKAGGVDENHDEVGISHFLEHMMFQGTNRYSSNSFGKLINLAGGNINAYTNYDYTVYHETFVQDYLSQVMKHEADRLHWLKLEETSVNKERSVILEEYNMRIGNNPYGHIMLNLSRAMYPQSNYGRTLIGLKQDINNITSKMLRAYYSKYYNTCNLNVFVVGDVSVSLLKARAKRYYKSYNNCFKNSDPPEDIVTRKNKIVMDIYSKKINQKTLVYSVQAPSFLSSNKDNREDVWSLILLKNIFNKPNNPLILQLRDQKRIVSDISVGYNQFSRKATTFNIYFDIMPNISMQKAQKAIMQSLLSAINKKTLSHRVIKKVAYSMINSAKLNYDSVQWLAQYIAGYIMSGVSINEIEAMPSILIARNTHKLQLVANKYLFNSEPLIGRIMPEKESISK